MTQHRPAENETDPRILREQVQHTREELGATVQELAAKTDVKARLHDTATRAAHATSPAHAARAVRSRPVPVIAAGTTVALIAALLLRRRLVEEQARGRLGNLPPPPWRHRPASRWSMAGRLPMAGRSREARSPMARLAARCG
jgi:ElaB/YqjD/DUF883 family membrane-anchored ribosome-binding protein